MAENEKIHKQLLNNMDVGISKKEPLHFSKVVRRLRMFFKLVLRLNYYKGIGHPSIIQFLYKWRVSPRTAWEVAKIIYP